MDNYPYVKDFNVIKGCHIISVVGWGEQIVNKKKISYWIIRNSWGDSWGDKGYFKMAMYPFNSKHALLISSKSDLGGIILMKSGKITSREKSEKYDYTIWIILTSVFLFTILMLVLIQQLFISK